MSSGAEHARMTTALIFPVAAISLFIVPDNPLLSAAVGAIGCATGLIIDPDLDIDGVTASEQKIIKKLGAFGFVWVALWYPYARLIPHRSPISHFPLLGTVGRVFYLLLLTKLLTAVFGMSLAVFDIIYHPLFIPWFSGLAIADTAHYFMDIFSTGIKRMRRKL